MINPQDNLYKDEGWLDIPNWSDYRISNYGRVFSKRRNTLLSIYVRPSQYSRVSLQKNNAQRSFTVHRLVANSFLPNPLNKKYVNHKDGNKSNSHVSNLEWCTQKENVEHAIANNLMSMPALLPNGEKHPNAKLSNIDVEMIRILGNHDFTNKQIAQRFGICENHVSLIKRNKTRTNDLNIQL